MQVQQRGVSGQTYGGEADTEANTKPSELPPQERARKTCASCPGSEVPGWQRYQLEWANTTSALNHPTL